MNVWLINPYGPIPGEGWRDYRCTMMGKALASRGHRVLWWTANFSHHFKKYRSQGWCALPVVNGFEIRLVPTAAYEGNIGIGRILFERSYARALLGRALQEARPDVIIAQSPSMTHVFNRVARHFHSKLVIDMFDLWPELFALVLPRAIRRFQRVAFAPLFRARRRSLRECDGLIGVCRSYVDAGLREMAPRVPARSDVFFIGVDVESFRKTRLPPDQLADLGRALGKQDGEVWAIYAGSLGDNYDIRTLLAAGDLLQQRDSRVKLIIAGDGPFRQAIVDFVARRRVDRISFVGKLRVEELSHYYQLSDIGLCPYADGSTVAMPTKVYDYLAAGLAIVNSLPGEVAEFLRERQIGTQYRSGDPESLVGVLEDLAADHVRREAMARNAANAAIEFDEGPQYRRFADFIETFA